MKRKQSVLITGGAGFIGSHLVDAYFKAGYTVTVVDSLLTGNTDNLPAGVTFYKVDVGDYLALEKVFIKEQPDYVNHHAAHVSLTESVLDPSFDAEVNILGSINVFKLATIHSVKKLVFASSGGALYSQGELPFSENSTVLPVSPYGVAKRSAELYLEYFSNQQGLPYTVLRYSNVYGPRQALSKETGVIAIFCQQLLAGDQITIYGDGSNTRDYIYVQDVAHANVLATLSPANTVFNVGTGVQTSVNELYTQLATLAGSAKKPKYATLPYQEQAQTALLSIKIQKELNWQPKYTLMQGLKETYQWYQNN